ncbi:MAG TPA: hypothetical protein VFZ59_18845 [Verrucomicrobiae bacterium]|nr:hypothetical protein [Verrucomicrobiae bacterium]
MTATRQYAVLQKDLSRPVADQMRRAFRSFNNLTDADAVRLAANAQGILLRHLSADEARAFHRALVAEGVDATLVAESELELLPPGISLHRLSLTEQALEVYDLLGRAKPIPWGDLAVVAAGAVRHVEISVTQTERTGVRLHPAFGVWPKKSVESIRKVESEAQLILEIVLAKGSARYELDAAQFPFKFAVDRAGLSTREKFVWLAREIGSRATKAILNRGAADVRNGVELVRGYPSRQAFTDEMIWLLWKASHQSS